MRFYKQPAWDPEQCTCGPNSVFCPYCLEFEDKRCAECDRLIHVGDTLVDIEHDGVVLHIDCYESVRDEMREAS